MQTTEIIERSKKGNRKAQSILFDSYYKQMYNVSMRIVSNHHDVEDVLITAFTRVFRYIDGFEYRGDDSLAKWIKTIVINESIRFIKTKKEIVLADDISEKELNANNLFFEEDIPLDVEIVYKILESMPVGYRVIFNLFALENYSHYDIAQALSISESTSKSQLRKARLYIINKLKETT